MEIHTKRTIQDNLNKSTRIRLLLHNKFYCEEVINQLQDLIAKNFEVFGISFNPIMKEIQIKIKKTAMKKLNDYECTSNYYYQILNPIFYQFFLFYGKYLKQIIDENKEEYKLDGDELDYLLNINYIQYLYGVTIILDNIIEIKL